jgi:hypothetical protein
MSRSTRPKQYLDALNNVIPYEVAQDAIRVSYEGGPNVRYYGTCRPNESRESNGDYERKSIWRIYRLTYDGNKVIKKDFALGSNDNDTIWDDSRNLLSISSITNANPGVVTVATTTWPDGTAIANGDKFELLSASGMTEVNGNFYFISGWNGVSMTFNLHQGNNLNEDAGTNENTSAFGVYAGSAFMYKRTYSNAIYN